MKKEYKIFICGIVLILFVTSCLCYHVLKDKVPEAYAVDLANYTEIYLVSGKDLISDSKDAAIMMMNTANLQKAIDDVSNSGGGAVYLPSGTFYFSQGGKPTNFYEPYAIKCRNNVHLIGMGIDEAKGTATILKPVYNKPDRGGSMDMFFFNNYSQSGFSDVSSISPTSKVTITDKDMYDRTITLNNQSLYLINADFSNFIIDGENVHGGSYNTYGKGFMINLFKDCDWDTIIVRNTDATGFGMDCPINSTIKNSIAISCGKAATQQNGGASGFGIGNGARNDESFIIENCIALNNKKFGFFFENQTRFNTKKYKATKANGFVVNNSIAGGNMYDFGGLKANDVTYQNVISVSGKGYYTVNNKNYNLNQNVEPLHFSLYSVNNHVVNANLANYISDVTNYKTEISWAINKGILTPKSATIFAQNQVLTRLEFIKSLYRSVDMEGNVNILKTSEEQTEILNKIHENGRFKDVAKTDTSLENDNLDAILWGLEKGILSNDSLFRGDDECTRAEFFTALYRLSGSPSVSGAMSFTDVKSNDWYYKPVLYAYKNGISNGKSSKIFDPNSYITKMEVAIALYRYYTLSNNSYRITYNLFGGKSINNTSYRPYNLPYSLSNPTKSGYTFAGWTGSNGKNLNKYFKIPYNTTGNIVYTANWTPNLNSIAIRSMPKKLIYNEGEKINIEGLSVVASYGDNNRKLVSSGFSISPTILNQSGTQRVTISYGGKSATFNVTVNKRNSQNTNPTNPDINNNTQKVTLTKINVGNKPIKTTYKVGEILNTAGLSILATYSDGSVKNITSGFKVTPTMLSESGNKTITVTYNGKSTTFVVNVIKNVDSVRPPEVNNQIDNNSNNNTENNNNAQNNDIDNNTENNNNLHNNDVDSNAEIINNNTNKVTLTKISINNKPRKLSYIVGDSLDKSGLSILATYSDGSTKVITSGYTISSSSFTKEGKQNVTVTYKGKKATFTVNVQKPDISNIKIFELPQSVSYYKGDKFSSKGLKLLVTYVNGYTSILSTGFLLSVPNDSILNDVGEKVITVTYQNIQTYFNVNVYDFNQKLIISKSPEKTVYKKGESLDLSGLELYTIDDFGNRNVVETGFTSSIVDGTTLDSVGTKKIDIVYGNNKVELEIEVIDITDIEIKKDSVETEFEVGNIFDSNGLILLVHYSNGLTEEISNGFKVSIDDGYYFDKSGDKNLTVTYMDFKTSIKLNVSEKNIQVEESADKKKNLNFLYYILGALVIIVVISVINIIKLNYSSIKH